MRVYPPTRSAQATASSLYWSFLDIGNEESLTVYGSNFEYHTGSALEVFHDVTLKKVTWGATIKGMTQPDGTDPMQLSPTQKSTLVKLLFSSVQNFNVDFGAYLHKTEKKCCQTYWFGGNSNTEPYCSLPPPTPPPPSPPLPSPTPPTPPPTLPSPPAIIIDPHYEPFPPPPTPSPPLPSPTPPSTNAVSNVAVSAGDNYSPPFPCLTVVGRERGAGTSPTQIV